VNAYPLDQIPLEFSDEAVGETRAVDLGGMTLAYERLRAGFETTPFFVGLPDDRCQSAHWGYCLKGSFRVIEPDGERVVRAGEAYYLPPGHNIAVVEDCELLELSPAEARKATLEHAEAVAASLV
jgi:hypothetical protein